MIRAVNTICFEGSKGCDLTGFRVCLCSIWGSLGSSFCTKWCSEGLKREVDKKHQNLMPEGSCGQSEESGEGGGEPL